MGRTVKIVRVKNLGTYLAKAERTQHKHIGDAIKSSVRQTTAYAKSIAPVYNPAKWENSKYAFMKNHMTPPGTLKASIHTKRMISTDTKYFTGIKAYASFASFVEEGFHHKQAKRKIPGRYFMHKAVHLVFKRVIHEKLEEAMHKIFK